MELYKGNIYGVLPHQGKKYPSRPKSIKLCSRQLYPTRTKSVKLYPIRAKTWSSITPGQNVWASVIPGQKGMGVCTTRGKCLVLYPTMDRHGPLSNQQKTEKRKNEMKHSGRQTTFRQSTCFQSKDSYFTASTENLSNMENLGVSPEKTQLYCAAVSHQVTGTTQSNPSLMVVHFLWKFARTMSYH